MAIKFLSGQTISGTLTVSGNVQGATFNSLAINTTGTNNVANQIVRTQSNGYVNFGWINSVSGNHTGSITRITASNDAYLRYVTPAQFRTGVTDGYYAPVSTVSGVTSIATTNGITGGTIISTGTIQVDSTVIRTTGGQTIANVTTLDDLDVIDTLAWRVSSTDAARQRADARDDATSFSRLHWFGKSATAGTSNFRHAYYDGANYINVTAASGAVTFDGILAATGGNSTQWNSAYANQGNYLPIANPNFTGTLEGPVFSGDVTASGDGQSNYPFRLGADYSAYMMAAAGNTWGLFWAGNAGARYGTNGNGGPGNIWSNSTNPNEFCFVGSDTTRWSVAGGTGDTWQQGNIYLSGTFIRANNNLTLQVDGAGTPVSAITIDNVGSTTFSGYTYFPNYLFHAGDTNTRIQFTTGTITLRGDTSIVLDGPTTTNANFTGTTATFSGLVSGITPTAAANFATKAYVDADNTSWPNVGAGIRTNYTLGFKPPVNSYAGFYFQTETGGGAGYLLIRGGNGSGAYTDNGISLIADAGWLSLVSRTTTDKGVRIMAGAAATTRLTVTSAGHTTITGIFGAPSSSGSASEGILRLSQSSGVGSMYMGFGDPYAWIQSRSSSDYSLNYALALNPNGGNVGIGTSTPAASAKLTVMGNQTFGLPGNGTNTSGRFISIEGNTDGSGEGSSRIFFTEHNSSTARMDNYGMSLGYRGGATSIVGASGNTWTGLTQIGNGQWGMWGHNDNATGALVMSGDRAATYVVIPGNVGIGVTSVNAKLHVGGNFRVEGLGSGVSVSFGGSGDFAVDAPGVGGGRFVVKHSSGNVGIGDATPSYKLDVAGTIRATGDVIAYSDARVKDNVKTIDNALDKVTKLRGVSYTRNDIEDKSTKIGVIAQEVLKVLPEVVSQDDNDKYSVSYGNITGVLIEAIKEQQKQIDDLKLQIKNFK